MFWNERWEGRKKEASKVKQTNKAKQHSTPKAVTFPRKNELPQVGLEPTTLNTLDRALYQLSYRGCSAGWAQISHLIVHLMNRLTINSVWMYMQQVCIYMYMWVYIRRVLEQKNSKWPFTHKDYVCNIHNIGELQLGLHVSQSLERCNGINSNPLTSLCFNRKQH